MAVASPRKLMLLPFHLIQPGSGLQTLASLLVYGLSVKLSHVSDLTCQRVDKLSSWQNWLEAFSQGKALATLTDLAMSTRSRYIVTGSINAILDSAEVFVESVRVVVRLFDANEQRMILDDVLSIQDFEPFRNTPERLAIPMTALNELLNWATLKMFKALDPFPTAMIEERLAEQPISHSYEALRAVVQAQETQRPIEERMQLYESAVRLDPEFHSAWGELGKLYKRLHKWQRSIQAYEHAFGVVRAPAPLRGHYANEAGIGHALMRQLEQAIPLWEHAIAVYPAMLNPYLNLAHALEDMDRLEDALLYAIKGQAIASRDVRPCYSLARLYSKMAHWPLALEQYLRLLKLEGEDPWCHSNIATCFLQLGNTQEAIAHLQKTVALDPSSEAASTATLILMSLQSEEEEPG